MITKRQIITKTRTELRSKFGIFWDLWNWAAEQICNWEFTEDFFCLILTENLNKWTLDCKSDLEIRQFKNDWDVWDSWLMREAGSGAAWLVGRLAGPEEPEWSLKCLFTVGETNSSCSWSNQQYLVPYLIIVSSFTASLFSASIITVLKVKCWVWALPTVERTGPLQRINCCSLCRRPPRKSHSLETRRLRLSN